MSTQILSEEAYRLSNHRRRLIVKFKADTQLLTKISIWSIIGLAITITSCTRPPATRLLLATFEHSSHRVNSPPDTTLPEELPVGDEVTYGAQTANRLKIKLAPTGNKELELKPVGRITHEDNWLGLNGISTSLAGTLYYSWDGILNNSYDAGDNYALIDFGATNSKFGRIHIFGNGKIAITTDYNRVPQDIGNVNPSLRHFVRLEVKPRIGRYDIAITDGRNSFTRDNIPFLYREPGSLDTEVIPSISFNGEGGIFFEERYTNYRLDNVYIGRQEPEVVNTTIQPSEIGVLCPTNLVSGDRDFGRGPHITTSVQLNISADRKAILAVVQFTGEEVGGDTKVDQTWEKEVYRAPAGAIITQILSPATSSVDFVGPNAGWEFGGCSDGELITINLSNNPLSSISIIGDTGYEDVSTDENCSCDTQIRSIQFRPISITILRD